MYADMKNISSKSFVTSIDSTQIQTTLMETTAEYNGNRITSLPFRKRLIKSLLRLISLKSQQQQNYQQQKTHPNNLNLNNVQCQKKKIKETNLQFLLSSSSSSSSSSSQSSSTSSSSSLSTSMPLLLEDQYPFDHDLDLIQKLTKENELQFLQSCYWQNIEESPTLMMIPTVSCAIIKEKPSTCIGCIHGFNCQQQNCHINNNFTNSITPSSSNADNGNSFNDDGSIESSSSAANTLTSTITTTPTAAVNFLDLTKEYYFVHLS